MSNGYWFRRTWRAYLNEDFKRPFCYNCSQALPYGFLDEGLECALLDIRHMDIAAKPICTEMDWIKYLMENV